MKEETKVLYSKEEEFLNSFSHGIGVALGVVFLAILLYKSVVSRDVIKIVGFSIYGVGLIGMFLSSSLYHGIQNQKLKKILRIFDHCAIFLCIAGTYTPIALLGFDKKLGTIVLSVIWSIALLGIVLKLVGFIKGKTKNIEILSLFLYLGMGWISLFLIKNIVTNIGINFFLYLLVGGIFYSVGVYFYKNKKIKFNHAIWHLFILFGSISMFIGILKYLA